MINCDSAVQFCFLIIYDISIFVNSFGYQACL